MLHMISCACYSNVAINFLEIVPRQHILSRKQFFKIFALSVNFCFSVVCGNTSLRYIPVSFNQTIGATTPFFTAIFAFLITCKKETAEVYLYFCLWFLGLFCEAEKLHSMNFLLYMAPMTAMILLPFALYIEGNVARVRLEKAMSDSFIIFLLVGNATVVLYTTIGSKNFSSIPKKNPTWHEKKKKKAKGDECPFSRFVSLKFPISYRVRSYEKL
ncbi:hypothetical protein CRYUN_Cryun11dG0071700 [Craigia yunnanensis]